MNTEVHCFVCRQYKHVSQFGLDKTRSSGRSSRCRKCSHKRWEKAHGQKRAIKIALRDRIKSENPCLDCGENDPVVLDFHHLGDKTDGLNRLANKPSVTLEEFQSELMKCVVLCSNCHRRRHGGKLRGGYLHQGDTL